MRDRTVGSEVPVPAEPEEKGDFIGWCRRRSSALPPQLGLVRRSHRHHRAALQGLYEAVPKQGGWAYTLGSATLVVIIVQFFTGIFLLLDYVPSVTNAYSSLLYLRTDDLFGDWIRGIHLWGAYV